MSMTMIVPWQLRNCELERDGMPRDEK